MTTQASPVQFDDAVLPAPANPFTDRVRNVAIMAGQIEIERMREWTWSMQLEPDHLEPSEPDGWRHPVTGRRQLNSSPELALFGRYLRRSRRLMSISQDRLARAARVSQTMISRAERALAPAMGLDPLTRLGRVLGRSLPLGVCPHDHDCAWQPIEPQKRVPGETERLIRFLLTGSRGLPSHEE